MPMPISTSAVRQGFLLPRAWDMRTAAPARGYVAHRSGTATRVVALTKSDVEAMKGLLIMGLDNPDTTNGSGQPNVVLIITDDQTWRQRVAMPAALAWFGWQGTIWHNYYVSVPWCGPSRATMVTGQYAFHHGLFTISPPLGGYDRLNNTNTLPVWLQGAGYRTAYIGKYINAVPEGTIPPGYDDWQAISATARRYYEGTINDNGTTVTYSNQEANYITDVLARRAVATIDRLVKAGSPFYLSVGATAPHIGVDNVPPTPAPRHDGLYAAETMPRSIAFNERDVSDKPAYVRARRLLDAAAIATIEDRSRWRWSRSWPSMTCSSPSSTSSTRAACWTTRS